MKNRNPYLIYLICFLLTLPAIVAYLFSGLFIEPQFVDICNDSGANTFFIKDESWVIRNIIWILPVIIGLPLLLEWKMKFWEKLRTPFTVTLSVIFNAYVTFKIVVVAVMTLVVIPHHYSNETETKQIEPGIGAYGENAG